MNSATQTYPFGAKLKVLALSFCVLVSISSIFAQDANIVFSKAEKVSAGISGTVKTPAGLKNKVYVFMLPLDQALAYSVRFLIAPSYQTEVKNGKFLIPFAEAGVYVVGAYVDSVRNGLFDIGRERFALAPGTPFEYSNEPRQFEISLARMVKTELSVEGTPSENPIYLQVLTSKSEALYVVPVKPPKIVLYDLPFPVRIGLAEDMNEDLRLDLSESPKVTYFLEHNPDQSLSMEWGKPWKSLSLEFPGLPDGVEHKITNIKTQSSMDLGREVSHFFFDFPQGEYRIDFSIPHPPYVISTLSFMHDKETVQRFEFSEKYALSFDHSSGKDFFEISMQGGGSFTIPATDTARVYQPGVYKVVAFTEYDDNSKLDPYQFSNDNIIFYEAFLDAGQTHKTVKPKYGETPKMLRGRYKLYATGRRRGQVVFFQKTSRKELYNTLQVIPLRKAGRRNYVKFYFRLDPSTPFMSFVDFDEDFQISEDENHYVRQYDASDPAYFEKKQVLEFPIVKLGSLEVLVDAEKPASHFIEVFSPKKKEVLASTFLSVAPTYLYQLPIEVPLLIQVTFDKNENQELDEGDALFPPQTVVISFNKKRETLRLKY
jgi:hypothetical protein